MSKPRITDNAELMHMQNLAGTLQTLLHGAIAQELPDNEVRQVVLSVIEDDRRRLDTPAAADFLGKSRQTLERWRRQKSRPRYSKDSGGYVRYRLDWLKNFQTAGEIEA